LKLRIKFLEKINLVSPIKMQIGIEMKKDKITYRPPTKPKSQNNSEPEIRSEIPSRDDQGMFEELLVQQRAALKGTVEDLGAVIISYEAKIAEHKLMIQEAKRKLEHIDGLME